MDLAQFLKINGNKDPLIPLYTIEIYSNKINYISGNSPLDIDLWDSDQNEIKDYLKIEDREIARSIIGLWRDKYENENFILLILCESYK